MKRLLYFTASLILFSCSGIKTSTTEIGKGWAKNSVNTVIFRKNAITSNDRFQFTAYYDENSNLVIARRKLSSQNWQIHITKYKGNTTDAHNAISIALDGNGSLHVSWDHHDSKLKYAVSKVPYGLELGELQSMTDSLEQKVSYPQFYNFSNGDLLFMYRSGQSGRGSLVLNYFDTKTRNWSQLHNNLIDGENERSAYWQAVIDKSDNIHLSWTWRETWDVSTNHDIAYAVSTDKGKTWKKTSGEIYKLPITEKSSELAWKIPPKSNLINQTSMTVNDKGSPFISSYWEENDTTQFQILYFKDGKWERENTGFRKTNFELGGGGTKKIPISRPEILLKGEMLYVIFRDIEQKNKVSLAYRDFRQKKGWEVLNLTDYSVGEWEPNYDLYQFEHSEHLDIFVQEVSQEDFEGLSEQQATNVRILSVKRLPEK